MKSFKSFSLFSSIMLIALAVLVLNRNQQSSFGTFGAILFLIIGGASLLIFLVNIFVSVIGLGKKYFIHPSNFLCAKVKKSIEYEQDTHLLFEKTRTILEQNAFHILKSDSHKHSLTARTKFNFRTMGENLYIDIQTMDNKSLLTIISTSTYGNKDYGHNSLNIKLIEDLTRKEERGRRKEERIN